MIQLSNISKIYNHDNDSTVALKAINLNIRQHDFIAIMGASGSGKSTLLNIIGCMDTPTDGNYYWDNQLVSAYTAKKRMQLRRDRITFVFQNFALMDKYTAAENIELPLVHQGVPRSKRKRLITEIADYLGIANQLKKYPKQMSGGQQQRVAIARALISGAELVLADEPTGALDNKTGLGIMHILTELNRLGKTVIIVTHNPLVAQFAKRVVTLQDGEIVTNG